MKKHFVFTLALGALIFSSSTYSARSDCDNLSNQDQKNMCYALVDRSTTYCGYIQKEDVKLLCLAQVKKNPADCAYINNNDLKAQCRALAN